MIMLALSHAAFAGKLADGYRGIPWGQHSTFDAPHEACSQGIEPGIPWVCRESFGSAEVTTAYQYDRGLFAAVLISGNGFEVCRSLHDTVVAGWGPIHKAHDWDTSLLADGFWWDGDATGSWSYNRFSGECVVVAAHRPSQEALKDARTEAAKSAAVEAL